VQDALMRGAAANRSLIAAWFRDQIAAGAVRAEFDADLLATSFDSLFSSYVMFARFTGAPPDQAAPDEAQLDALADLFVRGTSTSRGA
jgi:hypothetical protein